MSEVEERDGLVPELRFGEFAGTWKTKLLGKTSHWSSGGTPSKSESTYWNGDIPWISAASMRGKYYESSDRRITKKAISNGTRIAPTGSILLLVRGSMLYKKVPVGITSINVAFNQDVKCLIPKDDINTEYLFYFLRASEHLLLSKVMGTGIGAGKLDTAILKGLRFYYPEDPTEQQKIVDTLSSLDALITAHTDKLTALREHKQGLLQQLFPGAGELVPGLRFGGFEGEWQEEMLAFLCELKAGKFVRSSEINAQKTTGLFPCYGGNGLRGYTKSFTNTGSYSLIGRQGELCGNVTFALDKFHATEHAVVATPNNKTNTKWLYYLLVRANLNQYATGQAQPGLSVKNLEKLRFKFPRDRKEQEVIADCLTTLDNFIAAQAKKIKTLCDHKKGLMQRLFPKPNGK